MSSETAILAHLMTSRASIAPVTSLAEFSARVASIAFASPPSSVDRAAAAGFAADRLGYAFAGGYRAALARLVPTIAANACLCATEAGGGHPRFIKAALVAAGDAYRLDGTKTWVTLGTEAEELLVVASVSAGADAEGKNRLKMVHLPARRAGITLRAKEPAPFAPEIPHSEAHLDAVHVAPSEVLPGDGYDAYLKPFRTIEDIHVVAASLGYITRVARVHAWPHVIVEEGLATLLTLRALGAADASARETHLALGGAFVAARRVYAACDSCWADASPELREEAARWQRDRPILEVAEKARAARLATAWR